MDNSLPNELGQENEAPTLAGQNTCVFSQLGFVSLPLEIQTKIFAMSIDRSHTMLLRHVSVCRHWQEIIVGTPLFWRRLFLTKKTTPNGLRTWLERANWRVDSLQLDRGINVRRAWRLFAEMHLEDIWSTIQDLEVHVSIEGQLTVDIELPLPVLERLRLKVLYIDTFYLSTYFFERPCKMDTSQLESLRLTMEHTSSDPTRLGRITCTSLRELQLDGNFSNRDVFTLVRNARSLNLLCLSSSRKVSDGFTWENPPESIEHTNLSVLRLTSCYDSDVYVRAIHFPNLISFTLKEVNHACGARTVEALASQYLTRLERLHIESTSFFEGTVFSILARANALECLILSDNKFLGGPQARAFATVHAALANQIRLYNGELRPALRPFCPRLVSLDLSYSESIERENIVETVKARLPARKSSDREFTSSGTMSSSTDNARDCVLPIRTLNVKGCSNIDSNIVRWLKANVEQVII